MNALLVLQGWLTGRAAAQSHKMDKSSHAVFARLGDRPATAAARATGLCKRFLAPTVMLFVCLALASCSSFSGYVADHWPTWAGGMPKDVPPRPGEPGYEEFIAHHDGREGPPSAINTAPGATPVATTAPAGTIAAPAAPAAPAAANVNAQAMPPGNPQPHGQSAVQGGLY